eukprot:jgi/Mesvir1/17622/Mv08848-RA.1
MKADAFLRLPDATDDCDDFGSISMSPEFDSGPLFVQNRQPEVASEQVSSFVRKESTVTSIDFPECIAKNFVCTVFSPEPTPDCQDYVTLSFVAYISESVVNYPQGMSLVSSIAGADILAGFEIIYNYRPPPGVKRPSQSSTRSSSHGGGSHGGGDPLRHLAHRGLLPPRHTHSHHSGRGLLHHLQTGVGVRLSECRLSSNVVRVALRSRGPLVLWRIGEGKDMDKEAPDGWSGCVGTVARVHCIACVGTGYRMVRFNILTILVIIVHVLGTGMPAKQAAAYGMGLRVVPLAVDALERDRPESDGCLDMRGMGAWAVSVSCGANPLHAVHMSWPCSRMVPLYVCARPFLLIRAPYARMDHISAQRGEGKTPCAQQPRKGWLNCLAMVCPISILSTFDVKVLSISTRRLSIRQLVPWPIVACCAVACDLAQVPAQTTREGVTIMPRSARMLGEHESRPVDGEQACVDEYRVIKPGLPAANNKVVCA